MRLHAVRTSVPTPNRERWQPLRAGLVDLFYYDYQEFWFRDGRLMLRGKGPVQFAISSQESRRVEVSFHKR